MDKKLANSLRYGLWIALAALLLYFSFRGVNWRDFGSALRGCRWGFVILSMLLGAAAYWFRALRWRMQLLPLDASTSTVTTWNAANICTITNYVLPRVGEIVRCGYVVRHSGRDGEGKRLVSFDKALGTVVADRLWDGLSLAAVFLLGRYEFQFGSFWKDFAFAPGLTPIKSIWSALMTKPGNWTLRLLLGIFLIVCGVIHIVLGVMIRLGRSNPQMKEPWNFFVRFNGIVMVAVAIGYIFIAGILLGKPLLVVLFHLVSMIILLVLARDRKTSKTKRKDAAS